MQKTIHSPAHQIFCALFREERTKKGLSQSSLARELDKPQSFIAKVEKGERRVDLIEFLTIADAMELDPIKFIRNLQRKTNSSYL